MDFDKLEYCLAIAELKNFTKAAERFNIAQTAMSRQIASLEEEAGFRIFERNTRTVSLTPAGEVFCSRIENVLREYESAISDAMKVVRHTEGQLSIGIGHFERKMISNLLFKFHRLYQNIDVKITQCTYEDLLEKLNNGELDAVCAIPQFYDGINTMHVSSKNLYPVENRILVNSENPLASKPFISMSDLKNCVVITTAETHGPGGLEQFKKVLPGIEQYIKQIIPVKNRQEAFAMIESDMGVWLTQSSFRDELPSAIKAVPLGKDLSSGTDSGYFQIFYRKNNSNSALRCFLNGLEKEVEDISPPII